jgi:hypothetical protein
LSSGRAADPLGATLTNLTAVPALVRNALRPVADATGLPILVLTDGGSSFRTMVEEQIAAAGVPVVHSRRAAGYCGAPAHAADEAATGRTGIGAPADTALGDVLADFVAILQAAAAVVVAPRGVGKGQGLHESSFATVPALAGDTPHLTPVPFAIAGKMAMYETRGNAGRPLRGIFYLDDLDTFIRAVRDPQVRYRRRGAAPHAASGQS